MRHRQGRRDDRRRIGTAISFSGVGKAFAGPGGARVSALADVMLAVEPGAIINTNYALAAGLDPDSDTIAMEKADSPHVNIIVVRKGTKNRTGRKSWSRPVTAPK